MLALTKLAVLLEVTLDCYVMMDHYTYELFQSKPISSHKDVDKWHLSHMLSHGVPFGVTLMCQSPVSRTCFRSWTDLLVEKLFPPELIKLL